MLDARTSLADRGVLASAKARKWLARGAESNTFELDCSCSLWARARCGLDWRSTGARLALDWGTTVALPGSRQLSSSIDKCP